MEYCYKKLKLGLYLLIAFMLITSALGQSDFKKLPEAFLAPFAVSNPYPEYQITDEVLELTLDTTADKHLDISRWVFEMPYDCMENYPPLFKFPDTISPDYIDYLSELKIHVFSRECGYYTELGGSEDHKYLYLIKEAERYQRYHRMSYIELGTLYSYHTTKRSQYTAGGFSAMTTEIKEWLQIFPHLIGFITETEGKYYSVTNKSWSYSFERILHLVDIKPEGIYKLNIPLANYKSTEPILDRQNQLKVDFSEANVMTISRNTRHLSKSQR